MPFLGKDWRSSGDEWIRTELGWERTKVLECILDNLNTGLRHAKTSSSNSQTLNKSRMSILNEKDQNNNSISKNETDNLSNNNSEDENDDDDDDLFSDNDDYDVYDNKIINETDDEFDNDLQKKKKFSFSKLSISSSTSSIMDKSYKPKQPHIIYFNFENTIRKNNAPKASVSEVLNALDMPGAVKDIKRFNYVCRLVQLIINEKLHQLSGNAQRTLFLIVKQMLLQVLKTQENLNVMRKLLFDFKKKIQDSYYYYFYYIGSQKLCDKHLATINKWQQMLENPNNFKKVKRLNTTTTSSSTTTINKENNNNKETKIGFENIPFDCKLEIMRRLNTGLDLVNLSKCSRGLNDIISKELTIWMNLCQFHFQQTNINSFLNKQQNNNSISQETSDLDWKSIYFKLKRRYGHREVYVDMIHKCFYCKSLFWKEIGHPCIIAASVSDQAQLDIRTEPITPVKLVELLLR